MLDSHYVRIAFYESSNGPRLIIFGPLGANFKLLHQCFCQLAGSDDNQSISLDCCPWVYAIGGIKLKLISCNADIRIQKNNAEFGIHKTNISPHAFYWKQTNEKWNYIADLLNGLLDSSIACHQYLTCFPNSDVTVVVSKGEYDDDVWVSEK